VNDLDTRLERLADEATRHAVPPELDAVARRGRRHRRRQLAGSTLLVAAVVAAGLVLPARLAGRPGDRPVPAAAPATDVAGAAMLGGYWFDKTDASVHLSEQVTPAQRAAVRQRIEALDVVDAVYFETRAEALARLRELYRAKPGVPDKAFLTAPPPESFRVRLDAPEHFKRLLLALCPVRGGKAVAEPACMAGVDTVVEDKATLRSLLLAKPLATTSDVTVFVHGNPSQAELAAVRARLERIEGVAKVTYESPEQAWRRLPEKLRRDGRDPAKATPLYLPETVPPAFHVALDEPVRVGEFHRALCGSRTTGRCAGGLVVLEHPRRR
jgi:cell division protein FtsX